MQSCQATRRADASTPQIPFRQLHEGPTATVLACQLDDRLLHCLSNDIGVGSIDREGEYFGSLLIQPGGFSFEFLNQGVNVGVYARQTGFQLCFTFRQQRGKLGECLVCL